MEVISTTRSKSGPMRIVETVYNSGRTVRGAQVNIIHRVSTLAGRTLDGYSIKPEGAACAISSFRSYADALKFYDGIYDE